MKLTRRLVAAASLTGAAILLPACALASSPSSSTPKAGTASTSSAKTGTAKNGSTANGSTANGSTANTSASVHACTPSQLTVWLGVPGSAAAGSVEYPVEISNISQHTCYLYGYPGVSATKAGGGQLGSAAARIPHLQVGTVTIAPGQTAHADVQITDVGNFSPSACNSANAVALKVYAPGDFSAITVPYSFRACATAGPKYLHVTPVFIDAGIPGFLND